jgi:2-dehydro-3-deoxyphosphooctonate aldolase (KDO 8-P synthase)
MKTYYGNWDGQICKDIFFSENKPVIMAGPCMLERKELGLKVAQFLIKKCKELNLPYVFKTSYDKANRTSSNSTRGPGLEKGVQWLRELKEELSIPVLIDVHSPQQAIEAASVADIIQIPAFLCQQKELLAAAASTGKTVQIKKGQWASSEVMLEIARYLVKECKNPKVILVERGTNFGYNNLVVDFRNLVEMRKHGNAVVFDATHAVQLPGAGDGKSSGLREMVPPLVRAALAVGVDGIFMEVHEDPAKALSDADTQISMETAELILNDIAKFF